MTERVIYLTAAVRDPLKLITRIVIKDIQSLQPYLWEYVTMVTTALGC